MQYGIYLDNLGMRIDALDDSFYLDEQESEEYYHPVFLQERYIEDFYDDRYKNYNDAMAVFMVD